MLNGDDLCVIDSRRLGERVARRRCGTNRTEAEFRFARLQKWLVVGRVLIDDTMVCRFDTRFGTRLALV